MTYSPAQAGILDGTDYWEQIGLIGRSTGMELLLSFNPVMVAPDAYHDTTSIATANSLIKQTYVSGTAQDWCSWNLPDSGSTTYEKVLVIVNNFGYANGYNTVGISDGEYSGAESGTYFQDWYSFQPYAGTLRYDSGGSITTAVTNNTVTLTSNYKYDPTMGSAIYCEAVGDVQKTFLRSEAGQWFQTISATDSNLNSSGFKSVGCYALASQYIMSPFTVWGIET